MSQPTGKTNAELSRRYIDAVLSCDDHGLVHRHGADRVLQAANTLAVLAVVDAVREGPSSLRDCINALYPERYAMAAAAPAYKVGDPDPTRYHERLSDACSQIGPGPAGYQCTWTPGHAGEHVAGDGSTICEVWA